MPSQIKKAITNNNSWVYTVIFFIAVLCICLAVVGIIVGAIALSRTTTLNNDKQSADPFLNWLTTNGTLYKGDYLDNIILLDDVPIIYTQIGREVLIRLPFIVVDDTLAGTMTYMTLHLTPDEALPGIVGDSYPWGASSSVQIASQTFFVNDPANTVNGEIYAIELGIPGQAFIYEFFPGPPVPADSTVVIRGGLFQYLTAEVVVASSSTTSLKTYTVAEHLNAARYNGGKLPVKN
jgi:hypothetical protein